MPTKQNQSYVTANLCYRAVFFMYWIVSEWVNEIWNQGFIGIKPISDELKTLLVTNTKLPNYLEQLHDILLPWTTGSNLSVPTQSMYYAINMRWTQPWLLISWVSWSFSVPHVSIILCICVLLELTLLAFATEGQGWRHLLNDVKHFSWIITPSMRLVPCFCQGFTRHWLDKLWFELEKMVSFCFLVIRNMLKADSICLLLDQCLSVRLYLIGVDCAKSQPTYNNKWSYCWMAFSSAVFSVRLSLLDAIFDAKV